MIERKNSNITTQMQINNIKPEKINGRCLMTTTGFTGARCPVNDDKAETHRHKQEANPSETGGLQEKQCTR